MRISFSRFSFEVKRHNNKNSLSQDDCAYLNNRSVEYIRSLTRRDLEDRVASVSAYSLEDGTRAKGLIRESGICVVPNFVPLVDMHVIESAFSTVIDLCEDFWESGSKFYDSNNYLIQKGAVKVSGHAALSAHDKAVIHIRSGQDNGMIDVFNVDALFSAFRSSVRPLFESEPLLNLLGASGAASVPNNLNLYINQAIGNTRGFHVDSYSKQVKVFLYLTDVLNLDDGPYTYVKGTHKDNAFSRVNKDISRSFDNSTEAPVLPQESIVPVLASKGSLVISDQGGFHRGFPQSPEGKRCVAVMNYK